MNMRKFKFGVMLFGAFLLSSQAHALGLNDAGVVGTIYPGTGQGNSVANEIQWSQYLLDLAADTAITADGNTPLDGKTEDYQTSLTDYNATLSGGFRDDSGGLTGWTSYEYVLAKYDGPNAGSVLFNVADYVAAFGTSLPGDPYDLYGNTPGQYALSHWTGFNAPAPAILGLMGIGLIGMVTSARLRRHKIS